MSLFQLKPIYQTLSTLGHPVENEPEYASSLYQVCFTSWTDREATLFCCARQTSPDTSLLTLYSLPAAAALPVTRDQAVCELAVNALILQLITVPGSSLLSSAWSSVSESSSESASLILMLMNRSVWILKPQATQTTAPITVKNALIQPQWQLKRLMEIQLPREAFNCCIGRFGRGKLDILCIQSLDGYLMFVEDGRLTAAVSLPNCLLPGPLLYCPDTDSLLTASSSYCVESYKYDAIMAFGSKSTANETIASPVSPSRSTQNNRRLEADWRFAIGELAFDIQLTRFSPDLVTKKRELAVLGERCLFIFNTAGQLLFQHPLEHPSICLLSYPRGNDVETSSHNLMIGTATNLLLIREYHHLVWAARTERTPMAIQLIQVGKYKGLIAVLDTTGGLTVGYLGTQAQAIQVTPAQSKAIDHQSSIKEYRALQKIIKETQAKDVTTTPINYLHIALDYGATAKTAFSPTLAFIVTNTTSTKLQNISLVLTIPLCFQLESTCVTVPALEPGEKVHVNFNYTTRSDLFPSTREITVAASYHLYGRVNQYLNQVFRHLLPLSVFGRLVEVAGTDAVGMNARITIQSNLPSADLRTIYADVSNFPGNPDSTHAVNFEYKFPDASKPCIVTLILSKTSGKYRLQSNHLHAIWPVLQDLMQRFLIEAKARGLELNVTFDENAPIHDLFTLFTDNVKDRAEYTKLQEQLAGLAKLFRDVQARLVVRYNDKIPTSIDSLDCLLETVCDEIKLVTDQLTQVERQLSTRLPLISSIMNLILFMTKQTLHMKSNELKLLESVLCPQFNHADISHFGSGWEECLDISVSHLLRTTLAKTTKDTMVPLPPMEVPDDINKVKKHVQLFLERLKRANGILSETVSDVNHPPRTNVRDGTPVSSQPPSAMGSPQPSAHPIR